MTQKIEFVSGKIIKKGSKFYFVYENKYFLVHFWDVEKYKLKPEINGKAIIFELQKPEMEHHMLVHGWVYPGLLILNEKTEEATPEVNNKKENQQKERNQPYNNEKNNQNQSSDSIDPSNNSANLIQRKLFS